MAWTSWLFAWFLAAASQAAEPVFVPDFTPGTNEEFAVTVMLQGLVVDQLLKDGNVVLTNDVVKPILGADRVNGCAVRPECPADLLPELPTRLAVVAKIERMGGTLVGDVGLFQVGTSAPSESLYLAIASGNEHLFATDVSKAVQTLLGKMGPSPESVVVAAARLIAGQPAPAPTVTGTPAPGTPGTPVPGTPAPGAPVPGGAVPAPVPNVVSRAPIKRYDGSTPHTEEIDKIIEGTGVSRRHLLGAEGAFRKSGLDARDWIYRAMPHAGRVIFEVRAGIGLGDTDRIADVYVEREGGDPTNSWFQEGPAPNRRVMGGVFVGFAPATMIDVGILAGPQYAERTLTTGLIDVEEGAVVNQQAEEQGQINALNVYVQPRVRGYLVPLGPAKPFLFTGLDLRIFNAYEIGAELYPEPPGGTIPGWVGGGGMMIDPGPIVGFFAEGMYIRHFGQLSKARSQSLNGPWAHDIQPLDSTSSITVGVTGGVQFRL